MHNKSGFIFLLFFIGTLSLTLKTLGQAKYTPPSPEHEAQALTHYMATRGLVPFEKFNLNHEGSFVAHPYRYKHCNGGWIIAPMHRNSEAVSLFERKNTYHTYKVGNVFYKLDENTYKDFPKFKFWLSQKTSGMKRAFGLSNTPPSPVLAIRSFGKCKKGNKKGEAF